LVLCVVPGARDVECVEEVVHETRQRTGGRVLRLMTSDAYPAYEVAILAAYGQDQTTTPSGRESRRMMPEKVPPPGLNYATVEKRRENGRVVEVLTRVVFGAMAAVLAALGRSSVSRWINTSFLERQNATDRRPEGAEDLHVLEGLAGARVDDLLQHVQLQLLLGGADSHGAG
jgi:hypothetical protein